MAGGHGGGDYKDLVVFLAAAGVVVPLFNRWKISPVLGFLAAGVLLGPDGLGRFAEAAPWPTLPHTGCTCVVRGNATRRQVPFLSRLVDSLPGDCADDAHTAYLALLDRALLDRFLSVREQHALVAISPQGQRGTPCV